MHTRSCWMGRRQTTATMQPHGRLSCHRALGPHCAGRSWGPASGPASSCGQSVCCCSACLSRAPAPFLVPPWGQPVPCHQPARGLCVSAGCAAVEPGGHGVILALMSTVSRWVLHMHNSSPLLRGSSPPCKLERRGVSTYMSAGLRQRFHDLLLFPCSTRARAVPHPTRSLEAGC